MCFQILEVGVKKVKEAIYACKSQAKYLDVFGPKLQKINYLQLYVRKVIKQKVNLQCVTFLSES